MEYWKKVDQDGITTTVENHSNPHEVPDAIRTTKEEYDVFIASLPEPALPEPTIDMKAEIKALKDRIDELEKK